MGRSRTGSAPAPELPSATGPRTGGHSPNPWPGPTAAGAPAQACRQRSLKAPRSRTCNTNRSHKQKHFPPKQQPGTMEMQGTATTLTPWQPGSGASPKPPRNRTGTSTRSHKHGLFSSSTTAIASSAHGRLGCSRTPDPVRHPRSTARPPTRFGALTGHFLLCQCPPALPVLGLSSSPWPRLSLSAARLLPCAVACSEKTPREEAATASQPGE